jgi:hypothetical protein
MRNLDWGEKSKIYSCSRVFIFKSYDPSSSNASKRKKS